MVCMESFFYYYCYIVVCHRLIHSNSKLLNIFSNSTLKWLHRHRNLQNHRKERHQLPRHVRHGRFRQRGARKPTLRLRAKTGLQLVWTWSSRGQRNLGPGSNRTTSARQKGGSRQANGNNEVVCTRGVNWPPNVAHWKPGNHVYSNREFHGHVAISVDHCGHCAGRRDAGGSWWIARWRVGYDG